MQQPPSGPRPPHYRSFTIILRHTTVSRTPLERWSARRRDLYLTAHNTHDRQTAISPGGTGTRNHNNRATAAPHWDRLNYSYISTAIMKSMRIAATDQYKIKLRAWQFATNLQTIHVPCEIQVKPVHGIDMYVCLSVSVFGSHSSSEITDKMPDVTTYN